MIHWLWTPISHHVWHCPDNSTLLLVSIATVHAFCWISVVCSLFTTDYLELMGIKQVININCDNNVIITCNYVTIDILLFQGTRGSIIYEIRRA